MSDKVAIFILIVSILKLFKALNTMSFYFRSFINLYSSSFSFVFFFTLFSFTECKVKNKLTLNIKQEKHKNKEKEGHTPVKYYISIKGITMKYEWYDIDKQQKTQCFIACRPIILQWCQNRDIKEGNKRLKDITNSSYKLVIFDNTITQFKVLKFGKVISNVLLASIKGENTNVTNHFHLILNTYSAQKANEKQVKYSKKTFPSYEYWNLTEAYMKFYPSTYWIKNISIYKIHISNITKSHIQQPMYNRL